MHIVYLQKYAHGFRGVLREPEQWVLFQWTAAGGLRRLTAYRRADFVSEAHFKGMMGRFLPESRFLPTPVQIPVFDGAHLERVWQQIRATTPPTEGDDSGSR